MNIFTCFCRTVLIVFLMLTFAAPFAMAEVVDIPDANLRTQIEVLLNKSPGDAITKADMQTLTLFCAVNANIHDLTGLEHATNLVWLELDSNAISDITPLVSLTQLTWLHLDNNPLSAESLDAHFPVLRARDVVVSYTLPSDVNRDGIVNIQDMISVTQHFGTRHFGTSNLAADVNGDRVVNIIDLTRVAGDIGNTLVSADTIDIMDAIELADLELVSIQDENLRKAVVAEINELGISLKPINGPKQPTDPIYAVEMCKILSLKAEAAGIESLIGLEYATNLTALHLGNIFYQDWEIMWIKDDAYSGDGHLISAYKYKLTKPETPNRISDLTPLQDLTNLAVLNLSCNAVENLFPLSNLTNLTYLLLTENQITDIAPLADLTNLVELYIDNYYYSPQWAGNNAIRDLTPLGNLRNLSRLDVHHNPIGSSISVVRNFPALRGLGIGCCGVSNFRPLVESPGLRREGSWVYLVYSPIMESALSDIAALRARGVDVEDGLNHDDRGRWWNNVENCLESYRESFRAAPALQSQLLTKPDVLSSLWQDLSEVPEETALLPNYPNPFNPETWIPYQLATPAEVKVVIHAADGRLVRTLGLGYQSAGVYQSKGRAAYWDGRNVLGEPVASGVYFYTLMAGDFTATRKLLIRK